MNRPFIPERRDEAVRQQPQGFPTGDPSTEQVARYGQKGGDGPTRGRKASIYEVTLPPQFGGQTVRKRRFDHTEQELVATGFMSNGKVVIGIWSPDGIAWEGDFGRLVARRVK